MPKSLIFDPSDNLRIARIGSELPGIAYELPVELPNCRVNCRALHHRRGSDEAPGLPMQVYPRRTRAARAAIAASFFLNESEGEKSKTHIRAIPNVRIYSPLSDSDRGEFSPDVCYSALSRPPWRRRILCARGEASKPAT